jgi:hypothetical protein
MVEDYDSAYIKKIVTWLDNHEQKMTHHKKPCRPLVK